MLKTERDWSLKDFSFEIHYLNDPSAIDNIGNANFNDILLTRCYPTRPIREPEFKKIVRENQPYLLKRMENIAETYDIFYCYFDINFTKVVEEHTKLDGTIVIFLEIRPQISLKNNTDTPTGFFKQVETPPEC